MTSPQDPEQRISDLEKQLADARRIADLERQLAEARSRQTPGGPARMADLLSMLQQLQPGIGGAFGYAPGEPPPGRQTRDSPPRHAGCRCGFVLAELLPFRWWYVFALFVVADPADHPVDHQPRPADRPPRSRPWSLIYAYHFWTAHKRLDAC